MILQMLLCLAVAWLIYGVACFTSKYSDARKIGIPIVTSPIGPTNVFWMLLQSILLPFLPRLPFHLGSFTRYNRWGWAFHDKCGMHLEFGDAWIHVTPSANWLYLSDADAVKELFSHRRDFIKPYDIYSAYDCFYHELTTSDRWPQNIEVLEIFGPNLITVRVFNLNKTC